MYLKKLAIQGFKSFAKKTVLEFETGITSIVGPNGSGKSNLADALRWAFGEQSMKKLRGKKSEDVIFAGSNQKARMGMAEVEVTFENRDRVIPLDYSEVVIGRRLSRDGTSEYLLNNNQVRLMDVQELLAKTGFGNSSYHVIGQGMIDQLILGGPSAIKEVIEEAAGIKPYYLKRDRSLRRLERTETNLEQVKALIKEIGPRLRSLRRQTKRMEKRGEVEQDLLDYQVMYFAQALRGLTKQLQEVEGKLSVFDKQLDELTDEIEELTKEIETAEVEREDRDETAGGLKKELEELNSRKRALLEEQAQLKGQLKAYQEAPPSMPKLNWQELKSKLMNLYEKFKSLLGNLGLAKENPSVWEKEAVDLKERFVQVMEELAAEEDSILQKEKQDKAESRLKALEEELSELTVQIKQREQELQQRSQQQQERKKQLFVKERLLRNKQDTLLKTRDQKNQLSVEQAKLSTRKETYEEEARKALGSEALTLIAEFKGSVSDNVQDRIAKLKKQLEQIGGVDDLTVQEHKETEERYSYLTTQLKDLEKGVKDLKTVIKELDEVIKKEFNQAYQKISDKFVEYFRILFGGGKATMSLMKEERPEEDEDEPERAEQRGSREIAGIQITATPPGKKLSTLSALSGGERALAAIAFLSSLLAAYPSPFVVLDEVDAALDEANSIRFGQILGQLADETQFITITHNRETMRQSHTLYGVTMGDDGVSRLLSLKLEEAAVYSSKN